MVATEDEALWPILRVDLDHDRNEARKSRESWSVGGYSVEKCEHSALGDFGDDGDVTVLAMLVSDRVGDAGILTLSISVRPGLARFGSGAFLGL